MKMLVMCIVFLIIKSDFLAIKAQRLLGKSYIKPNEEIDHSTFSASVSGSVKFSSLLLSGKVAPLEHS